MAETTLETIRLLVVSREPAVLRPLWSIAESNAWHVETAGSGWEAMERVQSGVAPHLLLLDLPRGDADGLHVLRWLRRLRPDLPVVVLCHAEDAGRKTEAMRLGAHDVLEQPFPEDQLEFRIRRHLTVSRPKVEAGIASEDVELLGGQECFIGAGPLMQKLRAQAELLAQADVPVLILGEKGSGKDTIAHLIHKFSIRSGFKFMKVNCAAMPGDLLEAELFGSENGSAAGGGRSGAGKFQAAEKGTILLDEITEMPDGLQARLLSRLQDQHLESSVREGAIRPGARILTTTSASVERALAEKKLREDLYYRLSAFTVLVPPLRQRKEEIRVLLRYFMYKLAKHYGLPPREFSGSVLESCQHYSWPGNLRQLEAFTKRYLATGDNNLSLEELRSDLRGGGDPGYAAVVPPGVLREGGEAGAELSGPRSLKSLIQSVKCEAERNAIRAALEKTGWNRKAAARLLKVSYRTLLYKIEQYQMNSDEPFFALPGERFSLPAGGVKGGKAS
ncbi:MAG: sigma-54 dependent transcriptional regulator [Candidatus Sulfotelmatobacter sp.]